MTLRFNLQETADALCAICSVAVPRTPKDILKNVRLEAKSDVLLLSATDLELSLRCSVTQVEVDEPGEVLVSAETFAKIVRECDDELLTLELSGNTLHIRGAGSHFQIVTHDLADFPPIPDLKDKPDITIGYEDLKRLIDRSAFSAARESTRYAINGVLWELEGKRLTLAATDGRRLAVAHGRLENAAPKARSAIVPSRPDSSSTAGGSFCWSVSRIPGASAISKASIGSGEGSNPCTDSMLSSLREVTTSPASSASSSATSRKPLRKLRPMTSVTS